MILARCPECSTTFRVRPEQLRARQGRVRCGQCQHPFNALESLVDNPQQAVPMAAAESSLFVLEEKIPDGIDTPYADGDAGFPPSVDSPERDEPVGEIPPMSPEWAPEESFEAQPDDFVPPDVSSAPAFMLDEDEVRHEPGSPALWAAEPAESAQATEAAEPEQRPRESLYDTPFTLPPSPHVKPPPQEEPVTEEALEDEASPALRQAAWAAGATLLTLALLAQGVLVWRNDLVRAEPSLRPALESLCAPLGCTLPLARDSKLVGIESSDIQPDASREARFTLYATLRNHADYQQDYPHLEITLTDARDKAIVRRVLEPPQWLPAEAPREAFAVNGEVSTRIVFEAPGLAVAGYRVYAFYP